MKNLLLLPLALLFSLLFTACDQVSIDSLTQNDIKGVWEYNEDGEVVYFQIEGTTLKVGYEIANQCYLTIELASITKKGNDIYTITFADELPFDVKIYVQNNQLVWEESGEIVRLTKSSTSKKELSQCKLDIAQKTSATTPSFKLPPTLERVLLK